MSALLIALAAGVGFIVAYHTYGRWLTRKVFGLDPARATPAHTEADGRDFVATPRAVVFGHHFTSIAGTGPIVGPAIAVMWGWLPALLWVVFGSIFIGAVHDFGALVVSLRHRGRTVGEVAGTVLNARVRLLFLLVLFMALTIVLAIFGLVIAAVLRQYPAAIVPCLVQIPLALVIGVWLHRRGRSLTLPSLLALGVMYASVLLGDVGVLGWVNTQLAGLPNIAWVMLLLAYSYAASVLPVWSLLQPRDYINSLQLLTALGLVAAGLAAAAAFGGTPVTPGGARPALEIVAPVLDLHPEGAPPAYPFLFITIACGAISGFHCLVSSGTSSKQLASERDAQFVGFGGMLTEGFLATLVILACTAGLGLGVVTAAGPGGGGQVLVGDAAWASRYADWNAASGLGAKVAAFVDGAANLVTTLGVPGSVATALMAVLVASFAGTTLDTACRLQRYVVQELAATLSGRAADATNPAVPGGGPWRILRNRHGATLFAVACAGLMAWAPLPGQAWRVANAGKGGLILWPMFGATNQLLGGLAFLVLLFWLRRTGRRSFFVWPPLVFMLAMPAWALVYQLPGWVWPAAAETPRNWLLIVIAGATLVLEGWMVVEAGVLLRSTSRDREGATRG